MSLAVDLKSVFPNRGNVSPPRTIMPVAPAAIKTNRAGQRIDPLTGQPLYQRQEVVSLNNAFDEPSPFAVDSFVPESVEPVSVATAAPVAPAAASFDIVNFYKDTSAAADLSITSEAKRAVYNNHDPNRGELRGTNSEGFLRDREIGEPFISAIRDNKISLTKSLDSPIELDYKYDYDADNLYMKQPPILGNLDLQQGFTDEERSDYRDLNKRGSFIDVSGGESAVGEYTMAWIEDPPEPSGFDKFLNNPIMSIAATLAGPIGVIAHNAAKAANGQTLHGTDYLSVGLAAAKGLGMLQAPVNEAAAADAGTAAMRAADVAGLSNEAAMAAGTAAQTAATTGQGFTLFGKALSYNESVGLLTAAATGNPKSALVSIYGGDLIKGGLNKAGVTSDALAKVGIPAAAFEAALQKTVEKVAAGEELDDALAYGFVDYAKEGGLKNLFDMPESDISFAGIERVVKDIVRPIGSVATDLAHLVEDNTEGLEEFVRKGLSEFDDAAIQPTGEFLSDLDTEAREQLTKLDEGLYDIQSPFSTPEIDLPNFDLPSFNLPSLGMGMGMLLSGAPSGTATTGKIFENELFKFKNKIELTEFGPLNREQEVDIEDFLTSPFESAFTTSQRFA